jgi:DNA-binding response OmpR family regulator
MKTENRHLGEKKPTILLVENINQEWLEEELAEAGYDVLTVATTQEALETIQQKRQALDLVITDLTPGLNGLELAKEIKARWPELLVIIYSAYSSPQTSKESLVADDYIVKSSDLDELKDKVKFWIKYSEDHHPGT